MRIVSGGYMLIKVKISYVIIGIIMLVLATVGTVAIIKESKPDGLNLSNDEVQVAYDFVSFMDISELDPMYRQNRNDFKAYGEDEICKVYMKLHEYIKSHGMSVNQ